MTQKEFISRPHFCTDDGVALRGCYHDAGCEVIPASGVAGSMPRRTTAARDAAAGLHREMEIIKFAAKLEKVIALLTKRVKAENAAAQKKTVDQGLTADQIAAARSARACAEAREAYAARNPHRNDRSFV